MYLLSKRFFDLLVSLFVLLIILPFMIPVVVVLMLTGEHCIFYFQDRVGHKNKHFNIIKFATMLKNSPNMGMGDITIRNDPRLLPIGGFLRMTKVNELPQILNVIRGEMSLVGPRPLMEKSFLMYPETVKKQVYDSKPGITGIGSVIFRDEEKLVSETQMDKRQFYKEVIMPYKGALELWYNQNKCLKVDLWILFLTAWSIVNPKTKLSYKVFKNLPVSYNVSTPTNQA